MKTRSFEVPADQMPEFAEIIGDHDLDNTITGVNDENEILVDVHYEPEEKIAVFELMELLDPEDEQ